MMRIPAAGLLAVLLLIACSSGPAKPVGSARPSPSPASPSPSPTNVPLKAPGPFHYTTATVAQDLVAPWSVDFAKDGAIWFTERPGRVRVIRNGALVGEPALTLSVFTASGCEGGLLGLAVKEPYVYVYYTHSGGAANRVSRFTIAGDKLNTEQVLLDNIPGGTCYHYGGRIKFGPDGYLYVTTGEGFVAARAADKNNLSGKILRMHDDGSGQEMFAWGFRNPQGLAFDPAGRLYASNNGPTSDLGLCCHDEVDYVLQGAFYGWPAWAAGTRTRFGQGSLPDRAGPLAESGGGTVWAPSGMTFFAASKGEQPTLFVAELKGAELRRFVTDANDPNKVNGQEIVFGGVGRLRDAEAGPDGCLYLLTNNRDSRGSPGAGDDKILKLCPS
jgi:glucose/arabinose dehydrogenase